MSKPIVAGQKHASERTSGKVKTSFSPISLLDVPEWVKKDCEDKGQEYRWVDAKQMTENGNLHKNHWQIYRRDTAKVGPEGNAFGLPPDGTVRRGTVVLAVRPIEIGDGHRAYLKQRADRLNSSVKKQGAELKEMARNAGIGDRVIDETDVS